MTDNASAGHDLTNTVDPRTSNLNDFRARIRNSSISFTPASQRVCQLLVELSPEELLYLSAAELGRQTRTSLSTVVRTLQALGYDGLSDLKATLASASTSDVITAVRARSRIESTGDDLQKVWDKVTSESIDRIELVRSTYDAKKFADAISLLLDARSIQTYGFGASSLVAEHLARQLRRIGLASRYLRGSGFLLADEMLAIDRGSALVLFVPQRLPREVAVMINRAHAFNVRTILLTDQLAEQLGKEVDVCLQTPSISTGMTAEFLSSMVIADAIVQGVAALDPERTIQSSHTLGTLRAQLGF